MPSERVQPPVTPAGVLSLRLQPQAHFNTATPRHAVRLRRHRRCHPLCKPSRGLAWQIPVGNGNSVSGNVDPVPGNSDASTGINDPAPENSNPVSGINDPASGINDSRPGIINLTPGIINSTPGIIDLTPVIDDPLHGINDPAPNIRLNAAPDGPGAPEHRDSCPGAAGSPCQTADS
ncbi:MAG: hypothetical protein JNL99_03185 [Zoogloea sp.]|nr:hypothetical protein [Zoogloea sp.]